MLTIITPCSRQINLSRLQASIDFTKIDKWIIVYDISKDRKYEKIYSENNKILEVFCGMDGISGNPQRNYGMTLVNDGFIYFLDDDNIIHPDFWSIIDRLDPRYFYTFDQERFDKSILRGNRIAITSIDTAMFVVHKHHIQNIKWREHEYSADAYFIIDINKKNISCHKYINRVLSYYNFLLK